MQLTLIILTALLAFSSCPVEALTLVQNQLYQIEHWISKGNSKVNIEKTIHVAFTLRKGGCPPLTINNIEIPIKVSVIYLGLHIDKILTWKSTQKLIKRTS